MIEMKDLRKVYLVGDERVRALDHASLHIYPREFVSIIGPSGSGKSTLMNIIGCLDVADAGSYRLDGLPIEDYTHPIAIADYTDLSGVPMDEGTMTQVCTYPPESSGTSQPQSEPPEEEESERPGENPGTQQFQTAPIYEFSNGTWQQISASSISAGDILLFAADGSGEFVWIVRIQKAQSNDNSAPSSGGMGSYPQGGMSGYAQGGMAQPEPAFELYGLEVSQIAAVTPQDTMTLEITVDELDIKALHVGMSAQVKIDALSGGKYTAAITEIGNTGANSGGSSKYTVKLTLERSGNMLSGMHATAVIVLSTANDILTIPAEALVENGNQTVIYTGYDAESETLLNPVTVQTGISDGENVEILEGVSAGQSFYYAYYDTLTISNTPDFGGGFLFGRK